MDRFERVSRARADPPRFHLAERENPPVERDDVELPPAGAVIALDDSKASPDEVIGGEPLAELAEPMT